MLVSTGALAACGDSSSSGTSASKTDFCRTFDRLQTTTTPREAADALTRVGTPSDIGAGAHHGFEVLVGRLRDLPEGTKPSQISQMVRGLDAQDAADVRAFVTYYASECQGLPGDSSS
jgi:hypothetical protein